MHARPACAIVRSPGSGRGSSQGRRTIIFYSLVEPTVGIQRRPRPRKSRNKSDSDKTDLNFRRLSLQCDTCEGMVHMTQAFCKSPSTCLNHFTMQHRAQLCTSACAMKWLLCSIPLVASLQMVVTRWKGGRQHLELAGLTKQLDACWACGAWNAAITSHPRL
eukprot:6244736-Amphidinium_carterae.1